MNRIGNGRLLDGQAVTVHADGTFSPLDTADADSLPTLAPGLVDLQVNGFAGVDFSEALTFEQYVTAGQALYRERVTTYFPTIVTHHAEFITEQLRRLETYRRRAAELRVPDLAIASGYHLEGPFISPTDGYRGAHPLECVRKTSDPDAERVLREWQNAAGGRIALATFSPHGDGVAEFLRVLRELGIRASLGHTDATGEQLHAAARAGAVLATHLGNACAQLLPRHANPIWSILADESLWISMIGDGFHLPPDMLKVFWQVKGSRTILVSDATQYAGMAPGAYHTHIGGDVVLTADGKLHLAGSENVLAGAAKSLLDGWRNLVALRLGTPAEVWRLASQNPTRFLTGRDHDPAVNPFLEHTHPGNATHDTPCATGTITTTGPSPKQ